jgi:transposase-like protein
MQNRVEELSSAALGATERSEAERSETERSGEVPNAGADPTGAVRPDPEVAAKAKRRRFTAKYKQEILAKADAAGSDPGAIGALLRREKLYSSHLVAWRRQREASIRQGLEPRRRGPKSRRDPVADENQKLRRENERLTEKLRKAELIIDVQKKLAALLGASIPPMDREGQR